MKKEFPVIGYTEFNITIYNKLQDLYKKRNLDIKSYSNYMKTQSNKKYVAWNMRHDNGFVDMYFCNSSGKNYYSLQDLGLTTKIYELW